MSIIHYFSLHVESARSALKQLLRQPFGTLLTLIMLAVAMTLPLFMYLGIQSGQSVLGKLNESPRRRLYGNRRRTKRQRYRTQPADAR